MNNKIAASIIFLISYLWESMENQRLRRWGEVIHTHQYVASPLTSFSYGLSLLGIGYLLIRVGGQEARPQYVNAPRVEDLGTD